MLHQHLRWVLLLMMKLFQIRGSSYVWMLVVQVQVSLGSNNLQSQLWQHWVLLVGKLLSRSWTYGLSMLGSGSFGHFVFLHEYDLSSLNRISAILSMLCVPVTEQFSMSCSFSPVCNTRLVRCISVMQEITCHEVQCISMSTLVSLLFMGTKFSDF